MKPLEKTGGEKKKSPQCKIQFAASGTGKELLLEPTARGCGGYAKGREEIRKIQQEEAS